MTISPLAGKPAPKEHAGRPGPARTGVLRRASPTWATRTSWSASAPAGTAARRCAARSPRRTSWRSPRPSATTAAARASTARSTWARTRTRCPGRPSAPRSRCWRPTASRRSSSATTASRRRRSSRGPSSSTTAAASSTWPTASSSRRRTTRREDGGFKYNPPNGGPADTDVTRWVQDRANELLRERQRRREARAVRDGPQGGDARTRTTSSCPTSSDLRTSSTWTPSARAGLKLGVDPLGGAARAVLGADQRASTGSTSRS